MMTVSVFGDQIPPMNMYYISFPIRLPEILFGLCDAFGQYCICLKDYHSDEAMALGFTPNGVLKTSLDDMTNICYNALTTKIDAEVKERQTNLEKYKRTIGIKAAEDQLNRALAAQEILRILPRELYKPRKLDYMTSLNRFTKTYGGIQRKKRRTYLSNKKRKYKKTRRHRFHK
jgi:hypothetical protein